MKLFVGLGNPGKKYETTRHNVGFMCIDRLIKEWQGIMETIYLGREKTTLYESFEFQRTSEQGDSERITCIKPQTCMNRSGEAVKRCVSFATEAFVPSRDLWIIHDDIDLELGRIKIDVNASAGGHNGVKDIIQYMGTKNFIRFRIGIRPPQGMKESTDVFVLKKFIKNERSVLEGEMSDIMQAIEVCLDKGIEVARTIYNRKKR